MARPKSPPETARLARLLRMGGAGRDIGPPVATHVRSRPTQNTQGLSAESRPLGYRRTGDVFPNAVPGAPLTDLPSNPLVIMGNGQSNLVAIPKAAIGWSRLRSYLGADTLAWYETTGTFVQAVDGGANALVNVGAVAANGSTGQGPGLGQILAPLARSIADATGETVRAFTLAYTGQSIGYFKPDSATNAFFEDGSQHGSLNNFNLMKSYVDASLLTPQVMIWSQGEADNGRTQAAYYADLREVLAAYTLEYPEMHWIIIPTIGDSAGEIAGGDILAVRAAQEQLAAENPHVHLAHVADLEGNTSLFGDPVDLNHYTTERGYEVVYERVRNVLLQQGAVNAPNVPHLREAFSGIIAVWSNIHSVNVTGGITVYQSDVPALSLNAVGAAAAHLAPDPNVNNRATGVFTVASSHTYSKALAVASNAWTIFGVGRLDSLALNQCFLELFEDGTHRLSIEANYASNLPGFGVNGVFFSGPGALPAVTSSGTVKNSWCYVIDGPNLEWRYYRNGVKEHTEATADVTMTNPTLYLGSLAGTARHFGGSIALATVATTAATDLEVAAAHAAMNVEYELT